jgi:type II secretory pathway pseudopilin PulG
MFCASCGRESAEGAAFCANCGAPIPKPAQSGRAPASVSARGRGLSVASLVLGILAVFPFSFLAGIPAIVAGAVALAQKRLGRGMAIAGVVLGAIGTLVIGLGLLLAILVPNFVRFQDRARRSSVKNSMHVVQAALEAYAIDHNGSYPGVASDWSDPEDIFYAYLPGGDPVATDGPPTYGQMPLNPYSGERYRGGKDLFYFPTRLTEAGMNSIVLADREGCPFNGIEAPEGMQGTIVVVGYVPDTAPFPVVQEYAVIGFGRDVTAPLSDQDPAADGTVYFILHN